MAESGIRPAGAGADPHVPLQGIVSNETQFFRDGREGTDRWGRERKNLWACGTGWGDDEYVCLARGSLVLTREGYLPIEDVRLGQPVLTHRGRWRPVTHKRRVGIRPTILLRAQGVAELRLTPEHQLWARALGPRYQAADYAAGFRRMRRRAECVAAPAWLPAVGAKGSYVNLKLPPVESSDYSAEDWWIIGRWLGDGHLDAGGRPIISCAHHERADLHEMLGARAGSVAERRTAAQLYVCDPSGDLRAILRKCGRGAGGKRVPAEALGLEPERAEALLDGYLSADGNLDRRTGAWRATSVSRALSLGMAMIAQRARGVVATVIPGRPAGQTTIEGRTVTTRAEWTLTVPPRNNSAMLLDDGAWKRVRHIEPSDEVEVWDLTVEEDASFTAEGCVVKNCPAYAEESCPGEKGKQLRLNADRNVRCDLMCGSCGGGGRSLTMAYCGWERGKAPFQAFMNEMGGSLRLDRHNCSPGNPLPPWGTSFVPGVEWGVKDWLDNLNTAYGGVYPWLATTVRTASPGKTRDGQDLRQRLGGYSGKLVIHGLVKDDALDDAWDNRKRLFRWLKQQDPDIMVTPQFSYYSTQQNCMFVANMNRIFRWYVECQELGFRHVALDVPPFTLPWFRKEYVEFIERNEVKIICPSYQTMGSRGGMNSFFVNELRRWHRDLPMDVSFLMFGITQTSAFLQASACLPGRNVAFCTSDAFARAAFFRRVGGDLSQHRLKKADKAKMTPDEIRATINDLKGKTFAENVMHYRKVTDKASSAVARKVAKDAAFAANGP